ncbi:hypothetical protein BV898_04164 [Hypsibius exemplaris]|nr:hypothetical protein BV898_04164 [Hypsibius exemplaris]
MKWGGNTELHHYVCCNNCRDGGFIDTNCDQVTYQSASGGNYCGSCGRDRGAANCGESFHCGGCEGQAKASAACRGRWWNLHFVPGFCWTKLSLWRIVLWIVVNISIQSSVGWTGVQLGVAGDQNVAWS